MLIIYIYIYYKWMCIYIYSANANVSAQRPPHGSEALGWDLRRREPRWWLPSLSLYIHTYIYIYVYTHLYLYIYIYPLGRCNNTHACVLPALATYPVVRSLVEPPFVTCDCVDTACLASLSLLSLSLSDTSKFFLRALGVDSTHMYTYVYVYMYNYLSLSLSLSLFRGAGLPPSRGIKTPKDRLPRTSGGSSRRNWRVCT